MNKLYLLGIFIFCSTIMHAQEVCNNGIDDDGDGYIDCYDGDCSGDADCDNSYFGKPVPTCQFTPVPVSEWSVGLKWQTSNATTMDNRQTPVVADIDNDGMPEVIGKDDNVANRLYIFNGETGALERTINAPAMDIFLDAPAIADVDGDGFGEIFITAQNPDRKLYCYEHDGTLKWTSDTQVGYVNNDDRWTPSIADFNGDGVAEVYVGNQIYNAVTGVRIASGGSGNSKGANASASSEPFPVAVDVLPDAFCADCSGLELVCGDDVYSVDISGNSMAVEISAPVAQDGLTSIADMDFDGDLDAVVCTREGGRGKVYIWDIQTSTMMSPYFQIDNASAAVSNTTAGGHPNIADFNGDGTLEIGLAGNSVYVVIDFDTVGTDTLRELWSRVATDGSQRTGSTVFDFEGDGGFEVVYKDEDSLYIYNGADGVSKAVFKCGSGTRYDFPVVVDVNGDGETNIVCGCADNPGSGSAGPGYIVAFNASADPWIRARRIFNQHSYFNVNINDDMSVPRVQQNHSLGFPQGTPVNYPLNNFLSQSTELTVAAQPTYDAADAIVLLDSIIPNDKTCDNNDSVTVCFSVYNSSNDRPLLPGTPVALYNGNPYKAGSTFILDTITSDTITPGNPESLCVKLPIQVGRYDLFVLGNDNGEKPLPLTTLSSGTPECDYDNNTDSIPLFECSYVLAIPDYDSTLEETNLILEVTENDTNFYSNTGKYIDSVGTPTSGGVAIKYSKDSVSYTPPVNFIGLDTIVYRVCDSLPMCGTDTIFITVFNVTDTIQSNPAEDSSIVFCDTDLNGINADSVTTCGGGTNGSTTIVGNCFTYTPNSNYIGKDTLCYVVCKEGICDTTIITVTVGPGVTDTLNFTIPEDGSKVLCDTTLNGFSADSVRTCNGGSNGTSTIAGNCFTYQPNLDYNGLDQTCYIVYNDGVFDTTIVNFTITPVNDSPTPSADTVIVVEDTTNVIIDVQANDYEGDGQPLVTSIVSGPTSGGTLVLLNNDSLQYTPPANFNGVDTIVYQVCDPGPLCANDTVFITVNSINDFPVSNPDPITINEDSTNVVIDVQANDSDVDGDNLTTTIVGTPTSGGTATVVNGDSIVYNPPANFNGNDTIIYRVCDPSNACVNDTVFVTVSSIPDAPIANADNISVNEDTTGVIVDIQANDVDNDGDVLVTTILVGPTSGGTASVVNGDSLLYNPPANFNGVDTIVYQVCDPGPLCASDTVFITVNSINDSPVSNSDLVTINEDSTNIVIDVQANDSDADGDILTTTIVGTPTSGGTVMVLNGDSIVYNPPANFNGSDTIVYRICDPSNVCTNDTVIVTVIAVNDAPTATLDQFTTLPFQSVTGNVLTNDTDVDGDPLTITIITPPNNGIATNLGNGDIQYDPLPTFLAGRDTLYYQVCDNGTPALCDTAFLEIFVPLTNLPPDAAPDDTTFNEDDSVTVNVLRNDFDFNAAGGDTSTIRIITNPSNGLAQLAGDSSIKYIPNLNYFGNDTLIYEVCDSANPALCDTTYLALTILAVNDAPITNSDNVSFNEDTANVVINVQANDSDVEGGDLITTIVAGPTSGGVATVINGDSISYTPPPNFNGVDTIVYQVCDPVPSCTNDTVFITVNAINDSPVTNPDPVTINEDSTNVVIDVQANDSDIDGDNLTTTIVGSPTSGGTAIVLNGDSIVYNPPANFNGNDTIIYRVCDPSNVCVNDTVFVTVNAVNDAPVAVADPVTVAEDTSNVVINVQANDNDVDGDNLTTSILVGPTSGGVATVVNGDSILYTPPANFTGTDTIVYQVCDPTPVCSSDTIFVTVTATNDSPVTNPDPVTINEDSTNVVIDVQANDSDIDGDNLTTTILGSPTSGGTAIVLNGDSIVYNPPANFNGNDTIIYRVCDPSNVCVNDTVFVTVNAVNDAPVAVADPVTVAEDTSNVVINVQANDSDVDGDNLTTSILVSPTSGGVATVINGDSISYTPPANFTGTDTIVYQVCDPTPVCSSDTIFVTVTATNDSPVTNPDPVTINEDSTNVVIDVQANDSDIDGDNLTTTIVGSPTSGGTAIVLNGDSVVYNPPANFNGNDTIIYRVCDPSNVCVNDTVFVTVNAVNDAPVAVADPVTVAEDTSNVVINVQANDSDVDGDNLTTSILVSPTSGGVATVVNGDSILYTPPANFTGIDTIVYQVCDPTPVCSSDTIFVTVTATNDAPVTNPDPVTINEDSTNVVIDVQANDSDIDGDNLTTTIVGSPTSGGTAIVLNGDSIVYNPPANFNGNDTIIYRVCDPSNVCVNDTVFVTVNAVNDAPVAVTDPVTVAEDTSNVVINVQANDSDVDGDNLTTSILVSPTSGGVATVVNGDSLLYTPPANFTGTDTIVYQVCDPTPVCSSDTIFVTVTATNDSPVTNPDPVTINEDSTNVVIDVQANDSDIDGDNLTTTIVGSPTSGGTAIVLNGDSIVYNPPANFNGNDTIIYRVCDPSNVCVNDTVFVTVNAVNDAPVASFDQFTTIPFQTVIGSVLANDIDVDGDSLILTIITPPNQGTATIVGTDSIRFVPFNSFLVGRDTLYYQVCDNATPSLCDTTFLEIFVPLTNLPPDAAPDDATLNEDDSITVNVLRNDFDFNAAGGDTSTIRILTNPLNGVAQLVGDSSIKYIPNLNYFGNDTLLYEVCDSANPALCDTTYMALRVLPINDAPITNSDFISLNEDTLSAIINVQINDTDVEGNALTTTIISGPTSGGVATVLNGDSISYTPPASFNGADTIVYQVCDPVPSCTNDTVFITVNAINDSPVSNPDPVTINEDSTNVVIDVQANDSDIDGDNLTTTIVGSPTSGGTATVLNGDSIVYNPPANFNGNDTIIYRVCDPSNICVNDTVFVTVNAVNDAPVAVADPVTVTEDTSNVVINVQANDSDVDGDNLTTSILVGPTSGGVATVVNGDSLLYTPPANFTGTDTIVYQVCDPTPVCSSDTIFVTVTATNDAPVTNPDPVTINEDSTNVVIDVQANDSDIDGDNLTTTILGAPTSGGTATVLNGDSIIYNPPLNFNGNDTIIYRVCDPSNVCANDTVFVTVNPVNDAPIALGDTVITNEDSTTVINVQLNDIEVDGDDLTTSIIGGPTSGGSAIILNGDSISYTPPSNYFGLDTIIYQICDPSLVCDFDTVYITVNTINDTAVANPDYLTLNEDTANVFIDVQLNDIEVEGDILTTTIIQFPTSGGAVSVSNGDSLKYTPGVNFNGNDTIVYQICDPFNACDIDTVFITVLPINDSPVASRDNRIAQEDTMNFIIDVQANDFDADNDILTTSIIQSPTSGGIATVVNGDSLVYAPAAGFNGLDTIIYQVCDPGFLCAIDTVFINVRGVNDTPVARPDTVSMEENSAAYVINVQSNDIDVDGDILSTSIILGSRSGGSVVVLNGDSLSYTPALNFIGNDTITYQVCDPGPLCDTASIIITVTSNTDTTQIDIVEDSTFTVCDTTLNGLAADSVVLCDGGTNGMTSIAGNCFTYTPNVNYIGNDTLCYIVCNDGVCDTTIITVTVGPGITDTTQINIGEDSTFTVCDTTLNGLAADSVVLCDGGTNGMTSIAGNCFTYTPNANYIGNDTLCYIVCNDGVCDTTIITVTVGPGITDTTQINIGEDSTFTVCDSTLNGLAADSVVLCDGGTNGMTSIAGNCFTYTPNVNYIGNDTLCYIVCNDGICDTTIVTVTVGPGITDTTQINIGEDSTFTVCDTTLNGLAADSVVLCDGGTNGMTSIAGNCFTYTPNVNYIGNDTLCYIVCNDGVCDTTIITVTVGPGITDTTQINIGEDSTFTVCDTTLNGLAADSVVLCDGGTNGMTSIAGNCFTYTPNANYIGNDTLCYIVCNDGVCDTTIITVTVGPGITDTLPQVIQKDSTLTLCDAQLNGLAADSVVLCDGGTNGMTSITGNCFTYTPNMNYVGTDTLCYIVCNDGICDTTIVTLRISSNVIDTIPVIIAEDSSYTICDTSLIGTMADSTLLCDGGTNGMTSIAGNCFTYTPNLNYVGNDTLCYIVCNDGVCDTTIITVTVGPGITDTTQINIAEDSTFTVCDTTLNGLAADSVVLCDGGTNGMTSIAGNCFTYTPNVNYIGNDTLCYIVCNDGVCDTTIITVTVGPGITDTTQINIGEDSTFTVCDTTLNGLAADSVVLCDGGTNGMTSIAGNCFTYTPNVNYIGNDTLCYIVCNDGVCDTTIITVTVGPGITDSTQINIVEDSTFTVCDTTLNGLAADSVVLCDGGTNGMTSIAGNCFTYTPNMNYVGTDTLCYIVCNDGVCDTTIITVTVGPGITDTTQINIVEDSTFTVCDTTLNGLAADSVVLCDGGTNGMTSIAGNCFTYTPNANYIGNDTLCYIVCNDGICDTTIVTVTVGPGITDTTQINIGEDSTFTVCDTTLNGLAADSVVLCDGGTNGMTSITGNCFTYTPNANYIGNDTLCYIVCNDGVCDTTIITVTVGPGITDTTQINIGEDSTFTVCDTTLNGLTADSVVLCDGGTNGMTSIAGNCFTYTPNVNYIGNDTLCYIVCNDGVCDTTIITITVGPGITDTTQINIVEDSTFTICDTTLNGLAADSVVLCDGGTNGMTSIAGNCFTYTPNVNYIGNDTLCYIVCNDGVCDTTIITVTVGPGITDTTQINIGEDSTFTVCDTTLNGLAADSVVLCDGGTNGMTSIAGNCFTYTPNVNYIGNDTLCYIVCNDGVCDTTIITVTVGPGITDTTQINIGEDSTFTVCDTTLNGLAADSVVLCDGGTNGMTSIVGNCFTYTPNANYIGNDTLCYIVCNDGVCDTTIITVTVGPGITDTLPQVIQKDSTLTLCDAQLNGLAADSVVLCDGGTNGMTSIAGNCFTYTPNMNYVGTDTLCYIVCNDGICDTTIVTLRISSNVIDTIPVIIAEDSSYTICDTSLIGTMADSTLLCDGGTNGMTSIAGNCFTYTPNVNYIGNDTLCYIVCNDGVCDTTIITVTVGPGITDTTQINIGEDSTFTVCDTTLNGLAADSVVLCDGGTNGMTSIAGNCFTYTPNVNYIGNDTLCYIVCNDGVCDTTIITVTVGPGVTDTTQINIGEDSTFTVCDTTLNGLAADSVVLCDGGTNGMTSIAGNCFTYNPNVNYIGNDTLCYIVCNDGVCDTTIITVTVGPGITDTTQINIGEDSTFTVCDTSLNGLAADSVVLCDGGTNGMTSIAGNCFTYTPNLNYVGNDTLCYIVCNDGVCDTTIITVTVGPGITDTTQINIGEDSTFTVCDTTLNGLAADSVVLCDGGTNGMTSIAGNCFTYTPNVNYIGNDTLCYIVCNDGVCDTTIITVTVGPGITDTTQINIGEDSTFTVCDTILNGLAADSVVLCDGGTNGMTSIAGNCFTYTPNVNYIGNDTLCYIVCNDGICDTTIVTVIIDPVNDKPVIIGGDTIVSVNEDDSILVCLPIVDVDLPNDSILSFDTIAGCGLMNGSVSIDSSNCITYLPSANFVGMDSICIVVCDTAGLCDTSTIFINVLPINDSPVAMEDYLIVNEDTVNAFVDVQINDFDIDDDTLITTIVGGPTSGGMVTVINGDSIQYTPPLNFNGQDTIVYQICDTSNLCVIDTVFITVLPINDAPVAVIDYNTTNPNVSVISNVLLNDYDIDGDSLTSMIIVPPTRGAALQLSNGVIEYTPGSGFVSGNDTLTYQVCDSMSPNLCDTALLIITVPASNLKPIAIVDVITIVEDDSATVNVLANDYDVNMPFDSLSIVLVSGPTNGAASFIADSSFKYVPNRNFNGVDSIQYAVIDSAGLRDTAYFIITVTPVNDKPNAVEDSVITKVNVSIVIDVQVNDSDVDHMNFETSIVNGPSFGAVNVLNLDSVEYIPQTGFVGRDTLTYSICDPLGLCDTTEVYITVLPLNTAPIITSGDTSVTTFTDSSILVCLPIIDYDLPNDSILAIDTVGGCGLMNGTITFNSANCFTYTPNLGYVGMDTVCIVVCDTTGLCDTVRVSVNVVPLTVANTAPFATTDRDSTGDVTPITINILRNDFDLEDDSLFITIIGQANNGMFVYDGDSSVVYTPDTGFCGVDTLRYQVCDNGAPSLCDTAFVIVNVVPEDHDQDGIPSYFESFTDDVDGDNIPNYLDLDSDGDGISDKVEAGIFMSICNPIAEDCDNDRIPDFLDTDNCEPVVIDGFVIPEGVTPDGDGKNDTWFIKGLENYNRAEVLIFNRWGNEVYESKDYQNDWAGTSNGTFTLGSDELPSGTYFYILRLDNEKPITGFIYLNR